MRGMMYLARCLSTGISRLVCVQPIGTCTIPAGDREGVMLPVPTSGSNDWARAGVAMKIRTAAVVRTLFIPFSYSTLLGAHIAFPDARPSCCCESRWQRRTFAFNSPHLTTDRRVQHPTLNDRSATHVFVAAIGTTAFLRFRECSHAECAAIVWAVIVRFGS